MNSIVRLRSCLASFFCLLNFHHSSLITYHSIFHTCLALSPNFHYSIFFILFVGPYLSAGAVFYLFFFCFQYPNSPNLIKKKNQNWKPNQWKKKTIIDWTNEKRRRKKKRKKRREPNSQPRKKEKEKSNVVKSCGWFCLRVLHVCLITKIPLSYELWKLKTVKMCFQFL